MNQVEFPQTVSKVLWNNVVQPSLQSLRLGTLSNATKINIAFNLMRKGSISSPFNIWNNRS